MSTNKQDPIFYDESRRRGSFAWIILVAGTALCIAGAIAFFVTLIYRTSIPFLTLTGPFEGPIGIPRINAPAAYKKNPGPALKLARERNLYILNHNKAVLDAIAAVKDEVKTHPLPVATVPKEMPSDFTVQSPIVAAFYVNWDRPSIDSLKQHISQTTHLIPEWLHIGPGGKSVVIDQQVTPAAKLTVQGAAPQEDDIALQLAHQYHVKILPMIQNADDSGFHQDWLHSMLASPQLRASTIASMLTFIVSGNYQGINLDLETDSSDDRAAMTEFVRETAVAFHKRGLIVSQDIQVDSTAYDLKSLDKYDDLLMPMIYDEHASDTDAGPVASQGWFESQLSQFAQQVPSNKAVIGIANYGYDWKNGASNADEVSFQQACQIAQDSSNGNDGVISIDPASNTPKFTYYSGDQGQGPPHTVWLSDATTAYNEIIASSAYHPRGYALWRYGTEDPSLWQFFPAAPTPGFNSFSVHDLSNITYNYFAAESIGQGDILDVVGSPTSGVRTITTATDSKYIVGEHFITYPSQYVIRHTGLVDQVTGENTRKIVALTFDDGPSPVWTPQVLDILHRFNVPATFFVVGENVESHPTLLQDEWNSGMEIGNHSFTHPDMDKVSAVRTRLELDATQRVIEVLTGHMTTLFRAPNRADSDPATLDDFEPVLDADKLGYLFVGNKIDPNDWRPGILAPEIISSVIAQAPHGNCILLHDAGGQTRAETIKALPVIIQRLKAMGYTFVTVSALVQKPRSVVFPLVPKQQRLAVAIDRFVFAVTYYVGFFFTTVFFLTIGLGIFRIISMTILASKQTRVESRRQYPDDYNPTVSVVIAAYNESKVINKTIATLLLSTYPNIEIIVVDDGSKDNTAAAVSALHSGDSRITVLSKENGGKASALNLGIRQCAGEIVVALDADTVFNPETIGRLVRHFADSSIGAVSGNVKVGNRNNPLTIWQAVEYITSQNFDRRSFDLLNCITVVPGAVGAWRRDAIVLAGMYSSQTLAEDTDLTMKVRKLGYRIVTDNSALAYTEAPDTLRDLAKQRFRWAYGTLQCLWKHRDALLNPRYGAFGMVAMPSLWIFQIGFQALAPVVDLTVLWALLFGAIIAPSMAQSSALLMLGYWAVFASVELGAAYVAFRADKEDMRLLAWLVLQRFVYRQLMYYVIVKSLWYALQGSRVGWGKLERKGTVTQPRSSSADPPFK